ncbi:MAG: glutamate ligase domain-containing protein [Minisyncoccota bacterium]
MLNFKDIVKKILILLSVQVLKKHKPYIIAILGSVGKTTTRNALYTILSKKYSVRKSEQSITTDIGVPFTLLGCKYSVSTIEGWVQNIFVAIKQTFFTKIYPDYVILEIDGHTKGEIGRLVEWLKIDLLVITTIGEIPAHVENFETPNMMREEYMLIQKALKETSNVVVYADDEYAMEIGKTKYPTITYGSSLDADICASKYTVKYQNDIPVGISFSIIKPVLDTPIIFKDTLGVHVVNATLATMAVLQTLGEHPFSMNNIFEKIPLLPGRMKLVEGLKGSVIIDDTHNSSPVAVEELLSLFKKIKGKRKILVLGDMLELGRFSAEVHREIGRHCKGFDMLVCVGMRAKLIKEGALEKGVLPESIFHFDMPEKAGSYLQNILEEGDIVAIKGSQNMRMERCVAEIMAEPQKKEKLLVRQSEEWLGR